MVKKVIFVGLMMFYGALAHAEPVSLTGTLDKIPSLKQGVAFSLADSKLNYLSTVDVLEWKGVNLEAGVAADAEKTGIKAVVVVSYDLLNLEKMGVNVPILKYLDIRPGLYAGYGRINGFHDDKFMAEGDFGLSLSIASIKF